MKKASLFQSFIRHLANIGNPMLWKIDFLMQKGQSVLFAGLYHFAAHHELDPGFLKRTGRQMFNDKMVSH